LLTGFLNSLGLILAIGAQNAFVLRQGLLREHVLVVCLICGLSDAILITAGVAGFSVFVEAYPSLPQVMRYAGAAFLVFYGLSRFWAAWRGGGRLEAARGGAPLLPTALTCLALTWLNPHVYLDTVGLLGGISTQYAGSAKLLFGLGAVAASFVFFFTLGYGAKRLAPVMARPGSWRILDAGIGVVMLGLAAGLLTQAL
jgi:L-lysine exporter family protein LysE/ArgO